MKAEINKFQHMSSMKKPFVRHEISIITVYIVVDTVLYLYALPIDHFLTPFSSPCLSCNLSQA